MVQSPSTEANPGGVPRFAVLWDLDGVLVDTSSFHFEAWRRLMAEMGRELSEEEFRATFGRRNSEILRRWLPDLSDREIDRLSERKEAIFRELLPEKIPLLPGVRRLTMELADAGAAQAVASSTPRANLEVVLPRLGLPIAAYVGAEDVSRGKPHPEVFLKAAEKLSVPPARCVVIEDSVAGVEAARGAGMACVAVTTTWPRERLADADLVVDSLEEISVEQLRSLAESRQRA
jgi:beta-phosphoglucomutase